MHVVVSLATECVTRLRRDHSDNVAVPDGAAECHGKFPSIVASQAKGSNANALTDSSARSALKPHTETNLNIKTSKWSSVLDLVHQDFGTHITCVPHAQARNIVRSDTWKLRGSVPLVCTTCSEAFLSNIDVFVFPSASHLCWCCLNLSSSSRNDRCLLTLAILSSLPRQSSSFVFAHSPVSSVKEDIPVRQSNLWSFSSNSTVRIPSPSCTLHAMNTNGSFLQFHVRAGGRHLPTI